MSGGEPRGPDGEADRVSTGGRGAIREAFEATEAALVAYIAAGDPDAEATKAQVRALVRGGADVVELGLPFSEPIADGPTIQNAVQRALEAGMTPDAFLALVDDLEVDAPLVCMTYYNLVYQYGPEEGVRPFVEAAAEAGLAGLIVPDLPVEESGPLRAACDEFGLDLIFIVAPTTRGERLERIVENTSGFVYVQARLGTTGAREDVSEQTHESLARLDGYDVPKAVGFGVSEGEHAAEITGAGADGVVAGSAFVDLIAEQSSADHPTESGGVDGSDGADGSEAVPARLEAKARELKAGALAGAQRRPRPENK